MEMNLGSYDPFQAIASNAFDTVPPGRSAIQDAIDLLFSGVADQRLKSLLETDNIKTATVALQILSELGGAGYAFLNTAVRWIDHADWEARFYLADAFLASVESLDDNQLCLIVTLLEDSNSDVRNKSVELVARAGYLRMARAIREFSDSAKIDSHLQGIDIMGDASLSCKDYVIRAEASSQIVAGYCYAAMLSSHACRDFDLDHSKKSSSPEMDYVLWRLGQMRRYQKYI